MPEVLVRLWQRITELWTNLDKTQKIRVGVTAGVLGIAVALGIYFLAKPNMVEIAQNSDKSVIVQYKTALDTAGIASRMNDSQTSLDVNMTDRDKAMVVLSEAGFLKTGKTFDESLKSISITMTEEEKKHVWIDRNENQIIDMLKFMKGIKDVRVTITKPEQSTLFENTKKPTASIVVWPSSSDGLTTQQVQGIIDLVTGSVEGLTSDNVKITDNNLITLKGITTEDADGLNATKDRYSMKLKVKSKWETDIEQLLDGQSGSYDSFKVVAEPKLDFDLLSSDQKNYTIPGGASDPALLTTKNKTVDATGESASGANPGTGTNPTTNNTPTYPNGSTSPGTYKEKSSENGYIWNEEQKKFVKATGEPIPAQSTISITLRYGNRVKDATKLTPQLLASVKSLASTATGGVPVANISVVPMEMVAPTIIQPTITETITTMLNNFGMPVILALLAIALMVMAMPRRKKEPEPVVEEAIEVSADGTITAQGGPRFVVPEPDEPLPEIDYEEKSEIKKQLEKFVDQKPDAVAQLLRNWLQEDEWE